MTSTSSAVDEVRSRNDHEFANHQIQLGEQLKASLEAVENSWPPIAVRIIERNPLLQQAHEFEDVYLKRLEELEAARERTQDEIKAFADSQIGKARETAQGISVDAAQIQFDGAVAVYDGRVTVWVIVSAVLTAATLVLLWWFLAQPPDLTLAWGIAYFVSIRLAIFGVAATVTAFSFGMVKANMQLREANAHRARLANSVNAFLVASESPQQRDIILTRLVEAVGEHPDAGFVKSGTDNESRGRLLGGESWFETRLAKLAIPTSNLDSLLPVAKPLPLPLDPQSLYCAGDWAAGHNPLRLKAFS